MYDQIAPIYDLIHGDLKADLEFHIRQAAETQDPILELGCGTGRLLLPLARTGHKVTGIDNSSAMLEITRGKLEKESDHVRDRLSLVEGDISFFNLEQQYGLTILPYNTLYHLDGAGRRNCFICVHRHLIPGGRLLIDIDNPVEMSDPVDDGILLLERTMTAKGGDTVIVQTTSSWVDIDAQQRHTTWIFDASAAAGGPINRSVVTATFHYVNVHEFEQELEAAGLKLTAFYGDYGLEPFGEQSPRLLVIAKRLE